MMQNHYLMFLQPSLLQFHHLLLHIPHLVKILHDLMVGKVSKINDQKVESPADGVKPLNDSAPEMSEWEKGLTTRKTKA